MIIILLIMLFAAVAIGGIIGYAIGKHNGKMETLCLCRTFLIENRKEKHIDKLY